MLECWTLSKVLSDSIGRTVGRFKGENQASKAEIMQPAETKAATAAGWPLCSAGAAVLAACNRGSLAGKAGLNSALASSLAAADSAASVEEARIDSAASVKESEADPAASQFTEVSPSILRDQGQRN